MKPLRLLGRLVLGLVRLNIVALINFATYRVFCTSFVNDQAKSVVMGHSTTLVHSLAYCISRLPLLIVYGQVISMTRFSVSFIDLTRTCLTSACRASVQVRIYLVRK